MATIALGSRRMANYTPDISDPRADLSEQVVSVAKLIAGDRVEQGRAYKYYYGKMMGIPMRYTQSRDEAEEILNEAFHKVFRSVENYERTGSFSGWVARIVFNTTMDHVRKRSLYQKRYQLGDTPVVAVRNDAINEMSLQELYATIQLLPEASRNVFCLYVVDGYSHKEIGTMLSISDGTSRWHLNAARKKLQELLKPNNYE